MSKNSILIVGAGLLIGAGLGILVILGLGPGRDLLTARPSLEAALVPESNQIASDFELQSLDGESVRLSDLRGQPVVINFWATWCGPCRVEMPLLQSYSDLYQDEMTVLAINFDEPVDKVQEFADELNLSMPILLDPRGRVEDLYRVRAFPTTFFLDKEGVIRYQHIGVIKDNQLTGYLSKLGVGE